MPYAVGDIHGYIDQLEQALANIEVDGGRDAPVVFLGDYTDRGPDSRAVLTRLIDGVSAGRPWTVLLGNHDRMFLRFLRDGLNHDDRILSGLGWLHPRLGGATTLASYGVDVPREEKLRDLTRPMVEDLMAEARTKVPEAHLAFVENLALYHQTDDQLFVHAGLRPGVPLADQTEDDLIWIREPFLTDPRDYGRLVVHGHTPVERPRHHGNRLNLDTGAGYGHDITAAYIEGRDAWIMTGGKPLAIVD